MTPSEAFLARIFDYVKTVVTPELVEPVTKATAQAISTLMSDPFFTAELRVVADLRQENQWLKSQVVQLQRVVALATSSTLPSKRGRKPSAKKTLPKKSYAAKKSAVSPSARRGFNKGRSGR
jgi:hypothetical protein